MKREKYSVKETKKRFDAILTGAMHKPTPHKDVPKTRNKSDGGKAKK